MQKRFVVNCIQQDDVLLDSCVFHGLSFASQMRRTYDHLPEVLQQSQLKVLRCSELQNKHTGLKAKNTPVRSHCQGSEQPPEALQSSHSDSHPSSTASSTFSSDSVWRPFAFALRLSVVLHSKNSKIKVKNAFGNFTDCGISFFGGQPTQKHYVSNSLNGNKTNGFLGQLPKIAQSGIDCLLKNSPILRFMWELRIEGI